MGNHHLAIRNTLIGFAILTVLMVIILIGANLSIHSTNTHLHSATLPSVVLPALIGGASNIL